MYPSYNIIYACIVLHIYITYFSFFILFYFFKGVIYSVEVIVPHYALFYICTTFASWRNLLPLMKTF